MEGEYRPGWTFEYHNFYVDLYNVFNPVLSDSERGRNAGRFNIRAGRFYVPFGLNLQTDTHGTVLQLSNDRNLVSRGTGTRGFGAASTDILTTTLTTWLGLATA